MNKFPILENLGHPTAVGVLQASGTQALTQDPVLGAKAEWSTWNGLGLVQGGERRSGPRNGDSWILLHARIEARRAQEARLEGLPGHWRLQAASASRATIPLHGQRSAVKAELLVGTVMSPVCDYMWYILKYIVPSPRKRSQFNLGEHNPKSA